MLVVGGLLVVVAALLAGVSGFGLGIVSVPLLLLSGFSLPFVVTAVLLISLSTRISVTWRMRHAINARRAGVLTAAAVPGLIVGSMILRSTNVDALRLVVGAFVAAAAAGIALAERRPPRPRFRGMNAAAGFAGGVLGTSTSLTGVPPALLLTRRGIPTATFLADLAAYFVATSTIGLAVLAAGGQFSEEGARAFLWWLPGVIVANLVGTSFALRLPQATFRRIVLALAFVSGVATVATSLLLG